MRLKIFSILILTGALWHTASSQGTCAIPDTLFQKDSIIICRDTTFVLKTNNFPGATYTWSTGSTDTFALINQSGKYWLQVADLKCTKTDSVFVIFNSLIQSPPADTMIECLNRPAQPLRADGLNLSWYDTLAIGGTASPSPPVPTTNEKGEKFYYVSQTIMGCESPRTPMLVEVIDAPKFNLGKNILIPCGALGITLQVVAEKYTDYKWGTGDDGPEYDAPGPGRYILTASNKCGRLVDTVIAVACDAKCVRFPNAFTPNGDGLNDVFRPIVFCPVDKYKLVIFNRFGEKVFETTSPERAWDGRWQGKLQVPGTFVFFCQYNDFVLKQELMFKGSLTLIK